MTSYDDADDDDDDVVPISRVKQSCEHYETFLCLSDTGRYYPRATRLRRLGERMARHHRVTVFLVLCYLSSRCIGTFYCIVLTGAYMTFVWHAGVIVTLRASEAAAQCIVIGTSVGVYVCGSVTTITRNCVHRSSPNWICR